MPFPSLRTAPAVLYLTLLILLSTFGAGYAQTSLSSIIVRVKPGVSLSGANERIASLGRAGGVQAISRSVVGESKEARTTLSAARLERYLVVEVQGGRASQLLAMLAADPLIEEAFPNHRYSIDSAPNDSLFGEQWALERVEAEGAWKLTMGDSTIIVGFIDTGIDHLHPDLRGALAVNRPEDINRNGRFDPWPVGEVRDGTSGDLDGVDQDGNGYPDDVIGYDFVDQTVTNGGDWSGRDALSFDEQGHGTNVAGVIAATSNNRIGVSGLAPGIRLLALRAFDFSGNAEDDDIAAAIVYAADRGVNVLNFSFGDFYASPLMHDAIRYAYSRGVVLVASSGNEGGSDPHYPSSFPEVIGVGATNTDDIVSQFTTYGSQISLVAPGVGVYTTARGGGYARVSGTSFSSPYVAAAAALLLSLHPSWTPDEVRTTLELTADDRGRKGWDINYAAGRLNARRAVEYPGPPSVAIISPLGDDVYRGDRVVSVVGSASAPLFDSWQLFLGEGEEPKTWSSLDDPQRHGKVIDTLGSFSTGSYPSGVYTLRLLLSQTNGHTTERRVRLFLNPDRPRLRAFDTAVIWRFDRRALAVTIASDQITRATVWLRLAASPGDPYRPVSLEPERSGLRMEHLILLTEDEMERDRLYHAYVELRDPAGDTLLVGSPERPLLLKRDGDAFPRVAFDEKAFSMPYGYVLNETADLFGDGKKCLALGRFDAAGEFEKLMIYCYEGGSLIARDSVAEGWAPRGFGDSDGDGGVELLGQAFGTGIVFERDPVTRRPLGRVKFADSAGDDFYASRFYDIDGDGRDEVIARTGNGSQGGSRFFVAKWTGKAYERIAELANTSSPAPGDAVNFFGPPLTAVADFDGDGRIEILFGDEDADFMIYERQENGSFERVWQTENSGAGGSEYVASGDLNGDGRPEAIVAYHTEFNRVGKGEYAPPFWYIKVYTFLPDGRDSLLWNERIAYRRPTNLFRSGIEAGDLDGRIGDELVLDLFPNLYVISWDSAAAALRPLWWKSGAIGNRPIIADLDGDGRAELGVGDGSRIRFYGLNPALVRPDAPSGIAGWALNDSSVYLQWNGVGGADYYTVYRAESVTGGGVLSFDSVAVTTSTTYIDSGVARVDGRLRARTFYFYIISSRDSSLPDDESGRGAPLLTYTHTPSQILEATAVDAGSIRVRMSFFVRESQYRPGSFELRTTSGELLPLSSVASVDEHTLLLRLLEPRSGDSVTIRPTWLLRDFYDTPADTMVSATVRMGEDVEPGERFIATRATLVSGTVIAIDFNMPVDPAAAQLALNYTIRPGGSVVSASVDPNNPSRVLLRLGNDYPIGALGRNYTVTILDVTSASGRLINDGAGSVVGFAVNAENLAAVTVYPHPFSISRDLVVTVAGLTQTAELSIFTQSGSTIRTLRATEGNGGVEWNGTDERGEPVPPGIYLYKVSGSTPDGTSFESEVGKIAVVP